MGYKRDRSQEPVKCAKCSKEVIVLRNSDNKKVNVLFETLHDDEKKFVTQAGDVEYDRKRHTKHVCKN